MNLPAENINCPNVFWAFIIDILNVVFVPRFLLSKTLKIVLFVLSITAIQTSLYSDHASAFVLNHPTKPFSEATNFDCTTCGKLWCPLMYVSGHFMDINQENKTIKLHLMF